MVARRHVLKRQLLGPLCLNQKQLRKNDDEMLWTFCCLVTKTQGADLNSFCTVRVCDTLRHASQHGASTVNPYEHMLRTRHPTSCDPQQHGASTVEPYDELPVTAARAPHTSTAIPPLAWSPDRHGCNRPGQSPAALHKTLSHHLSETSFGAVGLMATSGGTRLTFMVT